MRDLAVQMYRDTAVRELNVEDKSDKDSSNYENIVVLHFPRDLLIDYFNKQEN